MEILFGFFLLCGLILQALFGGKKEPFKPEQHIGRQGKSYPSPANQMLLYDMWLDHLEGVQYRDNELYAGDCYQPVDDEDEYYAEEPDDDEYR